MKHKHYDMIVAWAAGEAIQFRPVGTSAWNDFSEGEDPSWISHFEYRVKPKETVLYFNVYGEIAGCLSGYETLQEANDSATSKRTGVIKATFEDGKIVSSQLMKEFT